MWRPGKVAGGCGESVEWLVILWMGVRWLARCGGCDGFTLPEEKGLASKRGCWVCCGLGYRPGSKVEQWGSPPEQGNGEVLFYWWWRQMGAVDVDLGLQNHRPRSWWWQEVWLVGRRICKGRGCSEGGKMAVRRWWQ